MSMIEWQEILWENKTASGGRDLRCVHPGCFAVVLYSCTIPEARLFGQIHSQVPDSCSHTLKINATCCKTGRFLNPMTSQRAIIFDIEDIVLSVQSFCNI